VVCADGLTANEYGGDRHASRLGADYPHDFHSTIGYVIQPADGRMIEICGSTAGGRLVAIVHCSKASNSALRLNNGTAVNNNAHWLRKEEMRASSTPLAFCEQYWRMRHGWRAKMARCLEPLYVDSVCVRKRLEVHWQAGQSPRTRRTASLLPEIPYRASLDDEGHVEGSGSWNG
jgi:hypothetical protein